MKTIFLLTMKSLLVFCGAVAVAAESEKLGVAEFWPVELPAGAVSKPFFEQWRAQNSPGGRQTLALDGLVIPVRDSNSMVRVAGLIIAPITGDYAFSIKAPELHKFLRPDETELWIQDDKTREWKLADFPS